MRVPSRVAEQLKIAHGIFAAGWAFMPSQEKKKKDLVNIKKVFEPQRMIA